LTTMNPKSSLIISRASQSSFDGDLIPEPLYGC
jgi:hypothetical protein